MPFLKKENLSSGLLARRDKVAIANETQRTFDQME